jgi:hypothetical protein
MALMAWMDKCILLIRRTAASGAECARRIMVAIAVLRLCVQRDGLNSLTVTSPVMVVVSPLHAIIAHFLNYAALSLYVGGHDD